MRTSFKEYAVTNYGDLKENPITEDILKLVLNDTDFLDALKPWEKLIVLADYPMKNKEIEALSGLTAPYVMDRLCRDVIRYYLGCGCPNEKKDGIVKQRYLNRVFTDVNGTRGKVIAYHNYNDVTVMLDDDTIVLGVSTRLLNSNKFYPANYYKSLEYKSTTFYSSEGIPGKVVNYRSATDMDVLFKNGVLRLGCSGDALKQLWISAAQNMHGVKVSQGNGTAVRNQIMLDKHKALINTTKEGKNGVIGKLKEYRSCTDVDIELSTGVVLSHVPFYIFTQGLFGGISNNEKARRSWEGSKFELKTGESFTVSRYIDCDNMAITFENNRKMYGVTANQIKYGYLKNPECYIGKTYNDVNGNRVTVVDCYTPNFCKIKHGDNFIEDYVLISHLERGMFIREDGVFWDSAKLLKRFKKLYPDYQITKEDIDDIFFEKKFTNILGEKQKIIVSNYIGDLKSDEVAENVNLSKSSVDITISRVCNIIKRYHERRNVTNISATDSPDMLDIPVFVENALKKGNIYTIEKLLNCTEEDLRGLYHLGDKGIDILRQRLDAWSFIYNF